MAWGEYFLTFWEFLKENTVPLQGLLAILAIVSFAAYRMHWLVSRARIRRKKAKAASPSDALPSLAIVADEGVVQAPAAPARAQGSGLEEGKPSVAVSLPEGQTARPQDAQFTPAESAQTPVPTAESPPPAAEPAAVAPEGERRNVTAAVLILSGLTSLGEGSDPEESERATLRIREQVQRAVEDNGGLVNQFLRDEVVAIFGIPAAHEDDPVRAVRAARAVGTAWDGPNGNPAGKGKLSVKAGIDTGLVLVKPGEEGGGRYAVTGTALTRAAELAAAAKKTQILVSGETQRRIAPYFDLKEGRAKKKGAGDPPFLVINESAVRTRFEASEWRGLTAFSGREQELVTLRGCLDKALGGQGQFVTIMGEAGIGKSRLLHEFRQGLDKAQINVLEGRCQSTGENTPYLPFVNALRLGLRLSDKDSPEGLGEKVAANILAIDSALEPYIPLFLHLLSLQNENHPLAENLKGEDLRAAIGQALGAFITQSALRQPMVFILEDWHWTDEASDAALRFFLGLVASIPLLLIVSLRPEYDKAWPNLSFHAHLVLQPLPDRQGLEIVRSAFGAEQLPEGLGEKIYSRTGGNPFFIEEMCSNLLEEGIVQIEGKRAVLAHQPDELILPGTVQAVIRSRLDRLDAESREVLQLASVIGREFDLRLLEHAHTDPSGLSDRLEKLKAQEILRQTRILPEPVYRFNHVLTQEVTYETLLIERRRALHELVGRVIEELYADRLEEHYEGLAHHFAHGNVWDKAVKYYLQAGIKARKKFAVASASDHFDHAERIVTERAPKLSWRVMYDLYLEKAQTLGNRGQWRFAYEAAQSAVLIAEREGEQPLQIQAMVAQCMAAVFSYQFRELVRIIAQLEPWVANDLGALVRVVSFQCMAYAISGDLQGALASENRMDDLFARKKAVPFFGMFFYIYGLYKRWKGEFDKSLQIIGPELTRAKESSPLQLYLQMVFHYGLALGELGRFEEAIKVLREGVHFGTNAGEQFATPKVVNSLAWAYHELCLFDKAIETNNEAMASIQVLLGPGTTNLFDIESHIRINLGDNYSAVGRNDLALENLNLVYENAKLPEYFFARNRWKPRCLLTLGEVCFELEDLAKAQSYLDEVVELGWVHNFPYQKYQVRFWRLQGRIFAAQGKEKGAEAEFKKALMLAEELGNPTQLWRTRQALGNLYAKQSKAKQAGTEYRAALKVVQGIADGLTDPELKEGFLTSGPIREVVAQAEKG